MMEFTNKKYEELYNDAIDMLDSDDDLFENVVNDLDSWEGIADGCRCFPMWEIDDLFCNTKISEFLDMITGDFDHNDDYFYESIWGIESTNCPADVYHDNLTTSEVLDAIIDNPHHVDINDCDLEEIIEQLGNLDPDEEDDEDDDLEDDEMEVE